MRYLTLLFCFLAASTAMAKDFTIATVDMQKLFKAYPGTPPAQKKFQAFTDLRKKDLMDSEKILESLKEELTGPHADSLTTEQKEEKGKEYQDESQNLQDEQTHVQNELAEKEQEMTQALVGKIREIVATIAQKEGVDLVLDSNDTVDVKSGVDLTDEVLAAFKNVSADSTDSSDSTDKP
ncbi:MAG TPA: OmpH family outer membrane protein [bacterium]|nr:OmpH family outer membrane protein [bacterium]